MSVPEMCQHNRDPHTCPDCEAEIDERKQLLETIAKLRDALEDYGEHGSRCPFANIQSVGGPDGVKYYQPGPGGGYVTVASTDEVPCDCGFHDALKIRF